MCGYPRIADEKSFAFKILCSLLSALESYHMTSNAQRHGTESTLRDQNKTKVRKEFRMVSCTICRSGLLYQHVRFNTLDEMKSHAFIYCKCNLEVPVCETIFKLFISRFQLPGCYTGSSMKKYSPLTNHQAFVLLFK